MDGKKEEIIIFYYFFFYYSLFLYRRRGGQQAVPIFHDMNNNQQILPLRAGYHITTAMCTIKHEIFAAVKSLKYAGFFLILNFSRGEIFADF